MTYKTDGDIIAAEFERHYIDMEGHWSREWLADKIDALVARKAQERDEMIELVRKQYCQIDVGDDGATLDTGRKPSLSAESEYFAGGVQDADF